MNYFENFYHVSTLTSVFNVGSISCFILSVYGKCFKGIINLVALFVPFK